MRSVLVLLLAPLACAGHYCVDWSPDGRWIAIGTDDGVLLKDAESQELVRKIPSWRTVHAVQFGAGSQDLLFAGMGNTFTIAGVDGRVSSAHGDVNPVVGFSAARSRDGGTVLSVDPNHDLLVWTRPFRKPVRRLRGGGHVWNYAITPDGSRAIAVDRDGALTLWDVASGTRLRQVYRHEGYVFAMAMSDDGRILATGGSALDRTVAIWDPRTLELRHQLEVGVVVGTLGFSPDGSRLAVGGNEKRVDIVDTASGEIEETLRGLPRKPAAITFAPDGRRLLIVSLRGKLTLRTLPDSR